MADSQNPDELSSRGILALSVELRKIFDLHLARELVEFRMAADGALKTTKAVDEVFKTRLKGPAHFQQQMCFALMCKTLSNAHACLESLRAGYFSSSLGIYRGVVEAFATGVLVSVDTNIAREFNNDRFSVQSSIDRLVKRTDTGLTKEFRERCQKYNKELHRAAHPTAAAVMLHFGTSGGFAIGCLFDPGQIVQYRTHVRNMRHIASQVDSFLTRRYISPGSALV